MAFELWGTGGYKKTCFDIFNPPSGAMTCRFFFARPFASLSLFCPCQATCPCSFLVNNTLARLSHIPSADDLADALDHLLPIFDLLLSRLIETATGAVHSGDRKGIGR